MSNNTLKELEKFLSGAKFFVYKVEGLEELNKKYEGQIICNDDEANINGCFVPQQLFVRCMEEYAEALKENMKLMSLLEEVRSEAESVLIDTLCEAEDIISEIDFSNEKQDVAKEIRDTFKHLNKNVSKAITKINSF